jgi:uncharacterized protein
MNQPQLLAKLKQMVLAEYPAAEVLLFGSRARGDATEISDWDFLILLEGKVSDAEKIRLHTHIFQLELETGELINPIIHTRQEWRNPLIQATPLYKNVVQEGVLL